MRLPLITLPMNKTNGIALVAIAVIAVFLVTAAAVDTDDALAKKKKKNKGSSAAVVSSRWWFSSSWQQLRIDDWGGVNSSKRSEQRQVFWIDLGHA